MPSDPTIKHLSQWAALFEFAYQRCRAQIQCVLHENVRPADERVASLAEDVNSIVGDTIQQILGEWLGLHQTEDPAIFYYGPGYRSVRGGVAVRPDIVLDPSGGSKSDEATVEAVVDTLRSRPRQFGCGFVFDGGQDGQSYNVLPLSIWMTLLYERVLAPCGLMMHGLTKWFELVGELAFVDQPIKAVRGIRHWRAPLRALCITTDPSIDTDSSENERHRTSGIRVIKQPADDAASLADPLFLTLEYLFSDPSVAQLSIEDGHEMLAEVRRERFPPMSLAKNSHDDELKELDHLVKLLFRIVHSSIFSDDQGVTIAAHNALAFLDKIDDGRFASIARRIRVGLEAQARLKQTPIDGFVDTHFTYYYALPLGWHMRSEDVLAAGPCLGSANVYTTFRLPNALIIVLRSALNNIYSLWRSAELQLNAHLSGEISRLRSYTHRTLGFVDLIHRGLANLRREGAPVPPEIVGAAGVVAWTTRVFRGSSSTEDAVFILAQDEEQPFRLYCRMAAAVALQKATRGRFVVADGEWADLTRRLQRYGQLRIAEEDSGIDHVCRLVGLDEAALTRLSKLDSRGWVRHEAFGTLFTHVLSQAVFHTIRARVLEGFLEDSNAGTATTGIGSEESVEYCLSTGADGLRVTIECETGEVRVRIENPGVLVRRRTRGSTVWDPPKLPAPIDEAELQLIAHFFSSASARAWGPSSEDGLHWSAGFTIAEGSRAN